MQTGWVVLDTWENELDGVLVEEGSVYYKKPYCRGTDPTRVFRPAEQAAYCPNCGQLFVSTTHRKAAANRDLHVTGTDLVPSICNTAASPMSHPHRCRPAHIDGD